MHVPGDTVYLHVTPGAGGHGAPEDRDPALVARDVRDGKISVIRARTVYCVAVSANRGDSRDAFLDGRYLPPDADDPKGV